MGGWTEHRDTDPRCPKPDGTEGEAVADRELVARLLHSGNFEPDNRRFPRDDLFPRRDRPVSDECGRSDGVSVIRRDSLTDGQVRARAQEQASRRPGRSQMGAVVASASSLRAIRMPEDDQQQAVFVYDDPSRGDALHAVVRGKETLNRAEQNELRNMVAERFAMGVPPKAE